MNLCMCVYLPNFCRTSVIDIIFKKIGSFSLMGTQSL